MDNFSKNAPLFYNHRTWEIPLGHVEDIRLVGDQWLGDVVIDGGNEEEKEMIRKIEAGDIKGISLGADPLETSSSPEHIKPGQRFETVTKWEPYEASLSPLPSNRSALTLRFKEKGITLSAGNEGAVIHVLNPIVEMKQVAIKLGLPEAATEAQIVEEIGKLQLSAKEAKEAISELAETLDGDTKDLFIELAATSPKSAIKLAKVTAKSSDTNGDSLIKLSQLIQGGAGKGAEAPETFDSLQRTPQGQDKLRLMKATEPDKYKKLVDEYAASKG